MATSPFSSFSRADIERIKGRSMLPSDTLGYIEALEEVARTAFWYWNAVDDTSETQGKFDDLYNALKRVDWMQE